MSQNLCKQPNKVKLATDAQLTRLRDWYSKAIGYWDAVWYVDRLRHSGMTACEASAEMDRLYKIREEYGASAMKPIDWVEIMPSLEKVKEFIDKRPKAKLIKV